LLTLLLKELVKVSAETIEDCDLDTRHLKLLRLPTRALPRALLGHDTLPRRLRSPYSSDPAAPAVTRRAEEE
jgi:hypothetical protein